MKLQNVTLRAEKSMVERARRKAVVEKTTLSAEFRRWLVLYVEAPQTTAELTELMLQFNYATPGKTFTRDALNER